MHIPRAVCMDCNIEMIIDKNGQMLEMLAVWGSYYKIYSDVYQCPVCEQKIALPTNRCVSHNGRAGYKEIKSDVAICFADQVSLRKSQ